MVLEKWTHIRGYKGIYEISNKFNVRRFGKKKNIKPYLINDRSYLYIGLYKNGIRKRYNLNNLHDKHKRFFNE